MSKKSCSKLEKGVSAEAAVVQGCVLVDELISSLKQQANEPVTALAVEQASKNVR